MWSKLSGETQTFSGPSSSWVIDQNNILYTLWSINQEILKPLECLCYLSFSDNMLLDNHMWCDQAKWVGTCKYWF